MRPDESEREVKRILARLEEQKNEEILRRLEDPDPELQAALDRLRKNYYNLYKAVRSYQEDPRRLSMWKAAEKPSPEWRQGFYFDAALRVLAAALSD